MGLKECWSLRNSGDSERLFKHRGIFEGLQIGRNITATGRTHEQTDGHRTACGEVLAATPSGRTHEHTDGLCLVVPRESRRTDTRTDGRTPRQPAASFLPHGHTDAPRQPAAELWAATPLRDPPRPITVYTPSLRVQTPLIP